ncbi:TRAP transporter substrate-binding protein [Kribbia dieselivorans]|uniref:TRAP transporter substrate-binding protein n=1 Tax=Kribbia dieselivorans TaxID=331526 RepID=UPI000837D619|nr:TRAP transporter substrate-binding protein DctP [Kribbia dieselivorans]
MLASFSLIGLLGACAGGATAATGNGDHVTIKIGDSFSATHPIGRSGTKVFLETLQKQGPEAGLEIEYFASGQLGKQRDMPALLRTGVAQIAAVSPAYVGTQLPAANVGDLPGFTEDSCVGATAMRTIMSEGTTLFEKELRPNDIRPLWVAYIPAYEVLGSDFSVSSPKDVEGTILRSTGGAADRVVDELGAAGVSMPIGDLYEAVSRGTVQGTLASPISITPYKLEEVMNFSTLGARLGSFTVTYSTSQKLWEALDDDQRAVLAKAADRAQGAACKEINTSLETSRQAMRDAGVKFVPVDSATRPQWEAVAAPVREKWVRDLEASGHPAQQVLAEFEAALKEAQK